MQLTNIENMRMIDRNKAAGKATFEVDGQPHFAELIFYLQSDYCLSIRAGRCGEGLSTETVEEYLKANRAVMKRDIKPEVEKLRQQQRETIYGNAE
ncbi:MAG: hypothetical protein ACM3PE_08925 [Deltaproteobacteria bacterium]